MHKGTIMEIAGEAAVVLTPDGQFVRVKAVPGGDVGQEITWSPADLLPGRRLTVSPRTRRWAAPGAFAAVLLVLVFALWSFRAPAVVAYVSMDINPSVEIGLDARERVRELRAVNSDAEAIVGGIAYKGKPLEEVVGVLKQKLEEARILGNGDNDIVIASVRIRQVNEEWESQVTEKIRKALQTEEAEEAPKVTIETVYLPKEVREEARKNGISAGKMAFWLAAENSGHSVSVTELQQKSVKSIASAWGGVKQVLPDEGEAGAAGKADKEMWKQLLEKQSKKLAEKAEEGKKSPPGQSGSNGQAKPKPSGRGEDRPKDAGKPGKPKDSGKGNPGESGQKGREQGGNGKGNGKGNGNGNGKGSEPRQSGWNEDRHAGGGNDDRGREGDKDTSRKGDERSGGKGGSNGSGKEHGKSGGRP